MSMNQNRAFSIVLTAVVIILIILNILSLRALQSMSMQGGEISNTEENLEQTEQAKDTKLIKTMENLNSRIDELCQILSSKPSLINEPTQEREPLTPESKPSLEGLEASIDRLARVISRSGFSSERNSALREKFDSISQSKLDRLGTLYSDKGMARAALLMMTYSEILEMIGVPDKIFPGSGCEVHWHYYPSDTVTFVDGYVSDLSFKK